MAGRKQPSWSVTRTRCKCDLLQRAVAEPGDPIVFDEEMHEYHITKPRGGYLMMFHCPFCGGATPPSKRQERFASVPNAEIERLQRLTARFTTVGAAVASLGKPDSDHPRGLRVHSRQTSKAASQITSYRMLTFARLSDVAEVDLTDYGVEGIRFSFRGKYLRKRRGRPTTKR
jgi:hypothetical protein